MKIKKCVGYFQVRIKIVLRIRCGVGEIYWTDQIYIQFHFYQLSIQLKYKTTNENLS